MTFEQKTLYSTQVIMKIKKIPLGVYEHYKGKHYKVIGVAKHSETLKEFIVYQALYGEHDLWIRPFEMFLETVDIGNKKVKRFKLIKENK